MTFLAALFDPAPGVTALDVLRAVLVVALAITQVLAIVPWDGDGSRSVGGRADRLENPVVPWRPAFAIWSVIFLTSGAFAIWQALPANLADPLLRVVGWGAVLLYGLNTVWETWVMRRGYAPGTVAVSAAMLAVALWLLVATQGAGLEGARHALVAVPFAIFAGWLSAAVFVNTSLALRAAILDHGRAVPDPMRQPVALALIGAAAATGIAVTLVTGAWVYALTVAYALSAILWRNRRNRVIAAASAGGLGLLALAAAYG